MTSPLLPELVTEEENIDEVLANVRDAFEAICELYDDLRQKVRSYGEIGETRFRKKVRLCNCTDFSQSL